MILQNYYAYLFAKIAQPLGSGFTLPVTITTLLGNTTTTTYNNAGFGFFTYSNQSALKALIGDSDILPTKNDYNMNNDRTNDFTNVSVTYNNTVSEYNGEQCIELIGIITGTNNTNDTITLREFGIYLSSNNTTGLVNQGILMLHELLTTPITVPPGETFQIPYSFRVF